MNREYTFIRELDERFRSGSSEIQPLARIWVEQKERLKDSENLKNFNQRLNGKWVIETGIIENLYSLDRGTTELLLEKGIAASYIPHNNTQNPQEIVAMLKAQSDALEGLFDFVKQDRPLSTSWIKELHQVITGAQDSVYGLDQHGNPGRTPLLKGAWKEQPNNPRRPHSEETHKYCPPVHVNSEMDNLIRWYLEYASDPKIRPEVLAAWLHHRFTQIHPFQDGNGRMARALASVVLIKNDFFPLVIDRDNRTEYIEALETADASNLEALIKLFTRLQKKAFFEAFSVSHSLLEKGRHGSIISSVQQKLAKREKTRKERQSEYGENVKSLIRQKLDSVRQTLEEQLKELKEYQTSYINTSDDNNSGWFYSQIVETARELGYYADTRSFREWVRLKICMESETHIVFSIHSLGRESLGILAASGFIYFKNPDENNQSETTLSKPICREAFQFTYSTEAREDIEARIKEWLDESIDIALMEWQQTI